MPKYNFFALGSFYKVRGEVENLPLEQGTNTRQSVSDLLPISWLFTKTMQMCYTFYTRLAACRRTHNLTMKE